MQHSENYYKDLYERFQDENYMFYDEDEEATATLIIYMVVALMGVFVALWNFFW